MLSYTIKLRFYFLRQTNHHLLTSIIFLPIVTCIMIVSAAIVSSEGDLFCSTSLTYEQQVEISEHANNFMYALKLQNDRLELPYIETVSVRYVYKQTDDLYWLLVTDPKSEIGSDINLLGKFVCTIMEYGPTDISSSNITDEQRELFYRHIWRPWDDHSAYPFISIQHPAIWKQEFEDRIKFLVSMRNGDIGEEDVKYFNGLIAESWALKAKIYTRVDARKREEISGETDSVCSSWSDQSIGEEAVIDGLKLQCRLEDIRLEMTRLQDPYLRLCISKKLLDGSYYSQTNQPTSSAPPLREAESNESCDLEQTQQM